MTTTVAKKSTKKRSRRRADFLPPSADVVSISGRDYIIAPFDEYQEWEEDRALLAIMDERMADGGPYITMEELEKHLDEKNKGRKK